MWKNFELFYLKPLKISRTLHISLVLEQFGNFSRTKFFLVEEVFEGVGVVRVADDRETEVSKVYLANGLGWI